MDIHLTSSTMIQFFTFRDNSSFNPKYAWANSSYAPSVEGPHCIVCGRFMTRYREAGRANVVANKMWPDVLGSATGPLLVSERTVIALLKLSSSDFEAFPVEVSETAGKASLGTK